jgi:NADH dehydrogenase [ubiquinone] 1 alpha subcomplex assembly factor 1
MPAAPDNHDAHDFAERIRERLPRRLQSGLLMQQPGRMHHYQRPLNPFWLRRRSITTMRTAPIQQATVAAVALALCFSMGGAAVGQSITEFDGKDGMNWRVVNDGVMGGLSEGKLTPVDGGTMKFSGMLSLENNGGFSSFRSGDVKMDLSSEDGLLLRVKGDGRTYQARLATDALFRGMEVSFGAEFATRKGEWIEVKVPFADFKGSFRGLDLPKERLDPSKVRRVSLLLGDKKQAPFEIEIDFIRTYRATAPKS